jgi:hypothetical protein
MTASNPKLSDTPVFSGVFASDGNTGVTQMGLYQSASWASLNNFPFGTSVDVQEMLPSAVRVQLQTGAVVKQTGTAQQYAALLSLSGANGLPSSLQLVPSMANAHNQATQAVAPNVFQYTYRSRNVLVAIVSASGLITPVSKGGVCVMIGSTTQVNASFGGATPTGPIAFAEIQITVAP